MSVKLQVRFMDEIIGRVNIYTFSQYTKDSVDKQLQGNLITIRKAPRAECARKDIFLNMFEIT